MGSLRQLQTATLERLEAVPGMSAIKARQVQTFLAQFPALPDTPAPVRRKPAFTPPEANAPTSAPTAFRETARRTLHGMVVLLTREHDTPLRPRLLRELARSAQTLETLAARLAPEAVELPACEQAAQNILSELLTASARPDLDRKEQARLADALAEITDALPAARG